MSADQLTHLIRHAASQGGDVTPYRYGHIATYDPLLHRVRCVVPSMTDQDGTPSLSGWMPLATMSAGDGYGVQVIPFGGATVDDPTAGEQVVIGVFDRQRGVAAVQAMFYHANAPPPATNLPTAADGFGADATAATPGDVIISAPPVTAGGANSFVRLRQSGVIEIWAAGATNIDVIGDVNVKTETGNVAVTAVKGNATVSALAGVVDFDTPTVNCSGTVVATGDVRAGGISLITHVHSE